MAKPNIEVCLSPLLFHLFLPENKIVVIIDILRATSTICTILNNRAFSVIPVETVEECLAFKNADNLILAAERHGKKADGFMYGNSPFDFPVDLIENKSVVLTTTNGTKAIELSRNADKIVIGSFLNQASLCDWLKKENKDVILFCAGWKGHLNFEDSLFAGAVLNELKNDFEYSLDSSLAVRYLYNRINGRIDTAVKFSSHYKRLASFGVEKDIEYCLQMNKMEVLPILKGKQIVDDRKPLVQETSETSF